MLKKILSGSACAECRLCCVFDESDKWETPVFTPEIRNMILQHNPETKFLKKDDGYIFEVGKLSEGELFSCPALTDKGCILGDKKPFDCRIWPYRIMNIGGFRAITIASICEELYNRPLSQLVGLLEDGLADQIFSYADAHPEIVKPYSPGYPALVIENKIFSEK